MTLIEALCFVAIALSMAARAFTFRFVGMFVGPRTVCTCVGASTLIGLALISPVAFYYNIGTNTDAWTNPWIILPAMLKGVLIWFSMFIHQTLVTRSVAAAAYSAPVGVGAIALGNYLVWSETLAPMQWLAVGALAVLGLLFLVYGDIKRLDARAKVYFLIVIGIFALFGIIDYWTISKADWFIYLTWTGVGVLATGLILNPRPNLHKIPPRLYPRMFLAWFVPEALILACMVTILPVSMAVLAGTMRIPINMMAAAYLYKESSMREQLLFSGAAVLCCLPLIFG